MNNNQDLIDSLRAMADHFDARPEAPPMGARTIYVYAMHDKDFAAWPLHLGTFEKQVSDNDFHLVKKFGASLTLEIFTARSNVCTRVVKGTKVIPAQLAKVIEIPATAERVEEIVEWECPDSLLEKVRQHEMATS